MTFCIFHVLGHPNLPLDVDEFPEDAQIRTSFLFCELLRHLKIPFYYYGVEGSRIPNGGEFVSIGKPTAKWAWKNQWHSIYTKRLSRALLPRIADDAPQLVASLYGAAHAEVDCGGLPVIEPMVGYNHCWAPYRVFPSYSHQSILYATCPETTAATRGNDMVIPHFLRPRDYPLSLRDEGYLLYLGRNVPEKGISIAKETARLAGLPLRVEHTGWSGRAKARLLGQALAVLTPTLYPEPFGYVAIEAQMCGTPVIATDWGAFPETVIPAQTGFLCRTIDDFVAAAKTAHSLDRTKIRISAIKRFSLQCIAKYYLKYFHFVLDSHQKSTT